MKKRLTMLMILDGFGIYKAKEGNAIKLANTPNYNKLLDSCPHTTLQAAELAVGLPKGQMGNSEVGHTNIGAGRIVYQDLTRITKSIEDKSFFNNIEFNKAIDNCINNNSNLHIIGLVSDGGVHSHINHLYALIKLCKKRKFNRVYIDAFTDGRDTLPNSGIKFIEELENMLKKEKIGKISTVSGRYYAMDRDKRWERIKSAYDAMVYKKGKEVETACEGIKKSYEKNITDEFIKPFITKDSTPINKNDSIIYFNFRPDRARQITTALTDNEFKEFKHKNLNLYYVCMTEYDSTFKNVHVAFQPEKITNTFGEYISKKGLKQLRIAETEKYAHVTFFFNGGREKSYKNEDRILIPSTKVATYDLKPEMSANEITDKAIEKIKEKKYDSIILNFANTDMVGHTGNLKATIKAVETVDECIGKIVKAIKKVNGILLITADHGNCEKMIDDKTNSPQTAHTTNLVPLIIYGIENIKLRPGKLSDISPTMLDLLNLDKPLEMSGKSLIIKE